MVRQSLRSRTKQGASPLVLDRIGRWHVHIRFLGIVYLVVMRQIKQLAPYIFELSSGRIIDVRSSVPITMKITLAALLAIFMVTLIVM